MEVLVGRYVEIQAYFLSRVFRQKNRDARRSRVVRNHLITLLSLFFSGNLFGADKHPIDTGIQELNDRIVYSPHIYGPDVYQMP